MIELDPIIGSKIEYLRQHTWIPLVQKLRMHKEAAWDAAAVGAAGIVAVVGGLALLDESPPEAECLEARDRVELALDQAEPPEETSPGNSAAASRYVATPLLVALAEADATGVEPRVNPLEESVLTSYEVEINDDVIELHTTVPTVGEGDSTYIGVDISNEDGIRQVTVALRDDGDMIVWGEDQDGEFKGWEDSDALVRADEVLGSAVHRFFNAAC